MSDRRPVHQVSTEELERILAIRKRKERAQRLRRLAVQGRIAPVDPLAPPPPESSDGPTSVGQSGGRYRSVDLGLQEGEEKASPQPRRGLAWGWLLNKFLLVVEIATVAGLIVVGAIWFLSVRETNESVKAVLATPTLAPRPLIDVVVLPSGHRPPTSPGGEAAPNPDEIPEHLRRLVQAITPQPIPTMGPGQPTRIIIKSISVDAPIVQGDDWEQLKKGVGHHLVTANPGERGNMVLSAHNDVYGEIFRNLERVEPKDEILVYSGSRVFRYVTVQKRIIEPTQVSVMYPTQDPTMTLITCYPYLVDNKRVVVVAELQP